MQKRNLRQQPFNSILQFGLLGIVVLTVVFSINHYRFSKTFPIKTVKVFGVNHVDKAVVQDVLTPLLAKGFFNVNVDYIRDRLMQVPWIGDIFVRRNWPDQVAITIVERNAIALWNNESLLSETGEFFNPRRETYPQDLPNFYGPSGKQIVMLQYYTEMNRIITPLHVKISYLELTSFQTWRMKLENGLVLELGNKDILTRLNQFVRVYPKVVGDRVSDVVYIDLRYPNGMAVRWKGTV